MNKFEVITILFFRKRFPEKDIEFEKKCGYFYEWVDRFEGGSPELYMDQISKKVWKEMQDFVKNINIESEAVNWAEDNMPVAIKKVIDRKQFESFAKTNDLEFVEKQETIGVTFPKKIII